MSSSSALENNEDLENVPLVRLEDIQPIDRHSDVEILETCVVDNVIDYENECVVRDDSDICADSEEIVEGTDEKIVPEILDPLQETPLEIEFSTSVSQEKSDSKQGPPDSWPTLEILPGGVIKHLDKMDDKIHPVYPGEDTEIVGESEEMMYACAKCSQSFKFLFCLVKHVRWHSEEEKRVKAELKHLNERAQRKRGRPKRRPPSAVYITGRPRGRPKKTLEN